MRNTPWPLTQEQVAGAIVWTLAALALVVLLFALGVGLWRLFSVLTDDGWRAALQSVDLRGVGLAAGGIATMVGVASAALVGYYKFNLFREGRPHLTIDLTASHRQVSPHYLHIGATARLVNTSKVVVPVRKVVWTLMALAPYPDHQVQAMQHELFADYRDGDEFGYFALAPVTVAVELDIEPGETEEITFDFIPEIGLESTAVTFFVEYNGDATGNSGWYRRIFYDVAG